MSQLETSKSSTEFAVEFAMSKLLRTGVIIAALVVLCGIILFLWQNPQTVLNKHIFTGEPKNLRFFEDIVQDALHFKGRGIIQVGVLLLIATPIMRVAFSVYAFYKQKDKLYIAFTLIVLTILLASLFKGH